MPSLLAKVLDFVRKGLLANLLTDPDNLSDHIRKWALIKKQTLMMY